MNAYIAHCSYLSSPKNSDATIWSIDDFMPYIHYVHEGRIIDNFFGGIIFEAYHATDGSILSGRFPGMGKIASADSWQEAIEHLFLADSNIPALVEASKQRLGGEVVDLWIALPYPYASTRAFGKVHGRQLHFRYTSRDRVVALLAWVEQVIMRWNVVSSEQAPHHTRLAGFVWTKGSYETHDEGIIAAVHSTLQANGLQLLWCTNYGANKSGSGAELGFDRVFLRPTYSGTTARGESWLHAAALYSAAVSTDLIVWGDERVSTHQLLRFLNVGCVHFQHARQIFELHRKAVRDFYKENDPKYVYLYAYTKKAYAPIPTPDES